MKPMNNQKSEAALVDEINIINRREIIPLLSRAQQVLRHYERVVSCPAAVLDSSGKAIENQDAKDQLRFCDLCVEHVTLPSQGQCSECPCPCREIHHAALAEARRTEGVYIYSCEIGFVFWVSPIYRNGRYAGALMAGQVVIGRRDSVMEKFKWLCTDKSAVQEFSSMLKKVPEKTHDEIRAMAEMLGLCAEEISERREDPCEMIRRKAWQEVNTEDNDTASKPRRGLLEKERLLLAAFRRGDNETGGKILKELMGYAISAMPGNLEVARFRAIELVVLLSRAAVPETSEGDADSASAGNGSDALLETNNRYLSRILESKTVEELVDVLHLSAERMSSKIFSFQGMRHASALRKAERFIWENYTRKLSLEEIAKASGLSAPYFSTIFKEEMGENLSSYLNRLRVERTVNLLTETVKPLNEIAKLCGFEDQSWFSKIFKSFIGVSPGKFRENGGRVSKLKAGKELPKVEITLWPLASGQSKCRRPEWDNQEMLSS